jgi:hypothetical protein
MGMGSGGDTLRREVEEGEADKRKGGHQRLSLYISEARNTGG